jgi:hypothetical protein
MYGMIRVVEPQGQNAFNLLTPKKRAQRSASGQHRCHSNKWISYLKLQESSTHVILTPFETYSHLDVFLSHGVGLPERNERTILPFTQH